MLLMMMMKMMTIMILTIYRLLFYSNALLKTRANLTEHVLMLSPRYKELWKADFATLAPGKYPPWKQYLWSLSMLKGLDLKAPLFVS